MPYFHTSTCAFINSCSQLRHNINHQPKHHKERTVNMNRFTPSTNIANYFWLTFITLILLCWLLILEQLSIWRNQQWNGSEHILNWSNPKLSQCFKNVDFMDKSVKTWIIKGKTCRKHGNQHSQNRKQKVISQTHILRWCQEISTGKYHIQLTVGSLATFHRAEQPVTLSVVASLHAGPMQIDCIAAFQATANQSTLVSLHATNYALNSWLGW